MSRLQSQADWSPLRHPLYIEWASPLESSCELYKGRMRADQPEVRPILLNGILFGMKEFAQEDHFEISIRKESYCRFESWKNWHSEISKRLCLGWLADV